MADLITLQGTAQHTGKKVTGYKFPDNLNDLKFPFKLIWHPNYTPILRGSDNISQVNIPASKEIVFVKKEGEKSKQNEKLITKEGYILNISKVDKSKLLISPDKIISDTIPNIPVSVTKAPTSTSTSNSTLEEDLNNSPLGKTARKIQIGFSVVGWGVFGILAYKFWNKSMTWKVMLSVFGAYNLYNTYKIFSKPALKVSGGSDSNTGTGTTTGTTTPKVTTGTTNNLTKSQKIDLIIKNQSGSEPVDADEVNNSKAFLNTLNDAELTIWIPLSKALKDTEISKAGESGDMRQLYGLLKSKYGLNQKEVEEQMKKMGEFLMGGVEQALQEGFTNQNQSAFSNFESSLNLDL
jgi:hypothetical protein